MARNYVVGNKEMRLVRLIMNFCMENHSEDFCCVFGFAGYVNQVDVRISSGGDKHPVAIYDDSIYADWDSSYKDLVEMYKDMKHFKREHDKNFSVENQEKIKKERRERKIEQLKRELESMESGND